MTPAEFTRKGGDTVFAVPPSAVNRNPQLILLLGTLDFLRTYRISPYVFGGWAEELLGLTEPRFHKDIDLFYLSPTFDAVDTLFRSRREIHEVVGKRFAHKRAFLYRNTLVELFLVQKRRDGYWTSFWGDYNLNWPKRLFASVHLSDARKIRLVSAAGLLHYRLNHGHIENARNEYCRRVATVGTNSH